MVEYTHSTCRLAPRLTFINADNLPQRRLIAKLEPNAIRILLQPRNASQPDYALDAIDSKIKSLEEDLERFGKGMQDAAGRQAFAPLCRGAWRNSSATAWLRTPQTPRKAADGRAGPGFCRGRR